MIGLREVVREWTRIGLVGFGGPPAHIALLRDLTVERRRWIGAREFEDALAACNLLPGPASTQLAVFCAGRVAGPVGAVVGGACFAAPGLVMILVLAAIALADDPPAVVLGAAAGAGAAVVAVVAKAGVDLARASLAASSASPGERSRRVAYGLVGIVATVVAGPFVVLALLACGLVEVLVRRRPDMARPALALAALASWSPGGGAARAVVLAVTGAAALPAVAWTAFKVGALSYGGGLVIVPLMRSDAVDAYGWLTDAEFLNAVALGQLTPGPVVQTVAVVGYAAAGLPGAAVATLFVFGPPFLLVVALAPRFSALRTNPTARAFLDGAGPAATGAILGAAVLLAGAIGEPWQWALLAAAALAIFVARRGVVGVLVSAAAIGAALAAAGLDVPR